MTIRSFLAPPTLLLTAAALLTGCPDDDTNEAEDGSTSADVATESDGEPTTSADASSGDPGIDVDALYECEDADFAAVPMFGPGFDPKTGEFIGPDQDTYIVHTTQILVRPEEMEEFDRLNEAIGTELMQTAGLLGISFAQEPNCGFLRTMGVWESEEAMFAFVTSAAHTEAMGKATLVSVTGRTTRWEVQADQMPATWEMALEAIDAVEPSPVYN